MIGIALLGAGGIAKNHIAALKRLQALGKARVVAVCDVAEERARAAAAETGAERWFTDHREMLRWDAVQAVDICTPNWTHGPLGLDCVRAGRHCLVEKPLAMTPAEAYAMVDAAGKAGVRLMGAHTHRFYTYSRRIKAIVESGDIGTPVYCSYSVVSPWYGMGDWNHWLLDPAKSGGQIGQNAIHIFDMLNFWLGARPVSVYAQGEKVTARHFQFEDYVTATMKYENGAIGTFEMGRMGQPRYLNHRTLLLVGTRGQISYDSEDEVWPLYNETGRHNLAPSYQEGFDYELEEFADAIAAGRAPAMPGEDAALAVEMMAAARRSMDEGQVVALKGGL